MPAFDRNFETPSRPSVPTWLQPISILFVDPDRAAAHALARGVYGQFATSVVGTAREAFALIRDQRPTIVVTELDLPDIPGLDFLARLRNHPDTRHVLLMVVTAHRGVQEKVRALQAGADDFLVKPLDPAMFQQHAQLVARFRQIIETPANADDLYGAR